MPILYSSGTVSVSSFGSFSSVGSYSKTSHLSFTLSLVARHIQEYFKNKRGKKLKSIKPHQDKTRHEERIERSKVIVRAKFVVGYW